MIIDPRQVIAARSLLGWTQADLAENAQIGSNTVKLFENAKGNITPVMVMAIQRTLEENGIEFISEGKKIGVTLRIKGKRKK